jgi:beta-carotene 3-hydroxylase
MNWSTLAIVVLAFFAMEPITAATHRWVMHGIGEFLHRSHHRLIESRFETNDWYPVLFAALVNLGFFAGFNWNGFGSLVPVGIGVTAYGATYALVHDVYIHVQRSAIRHVATRGPR